MASLTKPRSGGYPGHWVGRFIWDGGEATPFHAFRMFRKAFELATIPAEAMLHITAADRYVLYVNGIYLGHGPARSVGPQWMSYDTHDVAPHLRAGTNTVAVLAYFHGCRNAWSANQRAGLFAQLDWCASAGGDGLLGTDATWRMRTMEGYSRDVGMVNHWLGNASEVFDARQDPADWMLPAFDDSDWVNASIIPPVLYASDHWLAMSKRSCWSHLEPRLTPRLRERDIPVERVEQLGEVRELPAAVFKDSQIPERLAVEPHLALEHAVIEDPQSLVDDGDGYVRLASVAAPAPDVDARGARSPLMILDFGAPVLGRPVLEFDAPAGAVIDVACGH